MYNEIQRFFHGGLTNTLIRTHDLWFNLLLIKGFADLRGRGNHAPTLPLFPCSPFPPPPRHPIGCEAARAAIRVYLLSVSVT